MDAGPSIVEGRAAREAGGTQHVAWTPFRRASSLGAVTDQVFAAVERNRRAFADLVAGLSDEQLARPSLCDGWDCRTVALLRERASNRDTPPVRATGPDHKVRDCHRTPGRSRMSG